MNLVATLQIRCALADGCLAYNNGGARRTTLRLQFGLGDGVIDSDHIVAVNATDHIPAVTFKAFTGIVRKPGFDLAVDGDAVIIIQNDEFGQLQRAGQRTYLVGDAFHETAIANESIGVMVDNFMFGFVKFGSQQLFCQRKTHGIGQPLPQRAGGCFYACGDAHLGMSRCFGMQLAELTQLVQRQVIAGQVQQGVKQHGTMPVGQDKAIPIRPGRICRIVAQMTRPQGFGDLGHSHWGARMAGIGLLHGIHGQRADCIGKVKIRCCSRGAHADPVEITV